MQRRGTNVEYLTIQTYSQHVTKGLSCFQMLHEKPQLTVFNGDLILNSDAQF